VRQYQRIFAAVAIVLSGIALVPFMGQSAEKIEWQRYKDAYQPSLTNVSIVDFAFRPKLVFVVAGTTVRWTNNGDTDHTVTSDEGLFDSGTLQSDESFELTFDTPGSYPYFCSLHPAMTGQITVVESQADIHRLYFPLLLRSSTTHGE
jgi:plastocyanin